jgi:hypothetical protein
LAFLDWKRTCDLDHIDPKGLKHIFVLVIQTPQTREIFKKVFSSKDKILKNSMDVPTWARKESFLPNTDEGKALLNTAQVKGITWMLIQHRAHLGKKAIKNIYVFRDDNKTTNMIQISGDLQFTLSWRTYSDANLAG